MTILIWIFIAHTVIWAITSMIASSVKPEEWEELSFGAKIFSFFMAERQLVYILQASFKYLKALMVIWKIKRLRRKSL